MKTGKVICLLLATFVCGCMHNPPELPVDEAPHRASRDYEAIGDSSGIRPYVYGKRTLIKMDQGLSLTPSFKDDYGTTVNYRMQSGYYVLDKKLDSFTLYGSGRLVKFNRVLHKELDFPDENMEITTENNAEVTDADLVSTVNQKRSIVSHPIYAFIYEQMQQQRKLLRLASANPQYTGEELFKVNSKLDDIEYRIVHGNRAVVHVYFPFNNIAFRPEKALIDALLPLAKDAARINLYGRTDSKIADNGNMKIAVGRTESAKEFLVNNGVSADIIRASWLAAGDFIAPAGMDEGRRLNRRVTIEVILN